MQSDLAMRRELTMNTAASQLAEGEQRVIKIPLRFLLRQKRKKMMKTFTFVSEREGMRDVKCK